MRCGTDYAPDIELPMSNIRHLSSLFSCSCHFPHTGWHPGPGVTESTGLPLRQTLNELTRPVGGATVGEAIGLATSLEVVAISSPPFRGRHRRFCFQARPDLPDSRSRTATTFGPAFAERALTSGEGKVSVGVSFISANYKKLGDLTLSNLQLASAQSPDPKVARVGTTSLTLRSDTLVISGSIGVTDKVDVGLSVPVVKVALTGLSSVTNRSGRRSSLDGSR